jgi:hypothetical protein
MGLSHFPKGVSSFGVPLIGSGQDIPVSLLGKYFYVQSTLGNAGNTGLDPASPLATITQALAKCTANKGDVIVCMPGHTSTISAASGLNINVAGVTVVALGNGSLRPTITLDTAAGATIAMSAANCTLKGFIITANYADITVAIITSAADCRIEGCSFRETATNMNFLSCIATNATANASDGLTIINNERISIDAAALAFVSILANTNRLVIVGNFDSQSSAADVGHFLIMGSFVCLHAKIIANVLVINGDNNAQATGVFATGSSTTSTGVVAYNVAGSLATTSELFDTATLDFMHFENYYTGTIAKNGKLWPAADAT